MPWRLADQQHPTRSWAPGASCFPSKRVLTQESCILEAEVNGVTAMDSNPHPKPASERVRVAALGLPCSHLGQPLPKSQQAAAPPPF